ncbi:TRAP transporter small permease [Caviibacterium pharyngocola]|uniref:TRAP transporter small permease protein n=1 Tax=Caviibacterium pharyngocola TaxID=28159 RepID=A0A2M8RZ56_9PAST|nr:TRAP transporter small permease [Caviibacterium pharyngocola]PJG84154.1 TRAP transporter small permease [Caviibacterium pharyngocola]
MTRFISLIDKALAIFCVVLCSSLVLCVVWQVFSRYVLNDPSTVTDELARFLFIWVGLIGAAYGLGQKKHLAIDLLLTKLEKTPEKHNLLQIVITIIGLLFTLIIMCYGGGQLVLKTMSAGQISPVLGIEMGLIYLAIPLSGLFMLIFLCRDLIEQSQKLIHHK